MGLFRAEAISQKPERLHGTINLAVPLGWHIIAAWFAIAGIVAAFFLLTASYSRTETASGSIIPTGGLLRIVPLRPGRVEVVDVADGELVTKGQQLARVRSEQMNTFGDGMQSEILDLISRQRRGLDDQQAAARAAAAAEQDGFSAQISGLRQEAKDIFIQIAAQEKLIAMAGADFANAQIVAKRGFISQRDLTVRQESLLTRQQQLSALRQLRASKLSGIEQAVRAQRQAAARATQDGAVLGGQKAQIERERNVVEGDKEYVLVAPANGRVAGLSVHPGDVLGAQDELMTIVPSGGRFVARLNIPAKAIGFVHVGQPVRLLLDAFPHERFGAVNGTISVLSSAPTMRSVPSGGVEPVYLATVSIESPSLRVYGKEQALGPGMTLTARITVERRSLWQWLIDPLLASVRS